MDYNYRWNAYHASFTYAWNDFSHLYDQLFSSNLYVNKFRSVVKIMHSWD